MQNYPSTLNKLIRIKDYSRYEFYWHIVYPDQPPVLDRNMNSMTVVCISWCTANHANIKNEESVQVYLIFYILNIS